MLDQNIAHGLCCKWRHPLHFYGLLNDSVDNFSNEGYNKLSENLLTLWFKHILFIIRI